MGLVTRAKVEAFAATAAYIDLARLYNAPAALLPFLVGYYFYRPTLGMFNVAIGFLVVVLLHSATNIHNDMHDRDVDAANKRKTPLLDGQVTAHSAQQAVINLIFVSLIIAWFSTYKLYSLAFILAYVAVAWAYNSPPLRWSRRPIASIVLLGLFYSLLPLMYGLFLGGHRLTGEFLTLALLLTGIRMSVSILKDFKDAAGDKKHGKRTFYLVYGQKMVALVSCTLASLCYPAVCLVLLHRAHGGAAVIAAALTSILAIMQIANRLALFRVTGEKQLANLFTQSFVHENYFELMVVVCCITSY